MAIDFPAFPVVGQSFDAGAGVLYAWDGIAWNAITAASPAAILDVPPTNPAVGQLWFRGTTGALYIYVDDGNSKQWVQIPGVANVATNSIWEPIGGERIFSGIANVDTTDLAPYKRLRWIGSAYITSAAILGYRTSSDNGATFYNGASDYSFQYVYAASTTVAAANGAITIGYMSNTVDAGTWVHFHTEFENFNVAGDKAMRCHTKQRTSGSMNEVLYSGAINPAPAMNSLRLLASVVQNINGSFILEGVRG
jgi:hypothetical protein